VIAKAAVVVAVECTSPTENLLTAVTLTWTEDSLVG
jgi:hypothetical protein